MRKAKKNAIKTWSTPVAVEETREIPCIGCGEKSFESALDCDGFFFVRCRNCGLLQANPQPKATEVAARYRELHGTDYLAYELANEASFLRLQELALRDARFHEIEEEAKAKAAKEGRFPRVLDVGCATGALLGRLRTRGWDCAGLELCEPSANYARKERNLEVLDVPIERAALPANSFDLVLASHLIEHLNDPRAFAAEVRRVLRVGGRFLVTTPNESGLQARLFGPSWRSAIFDHLYLFSRKTLRQLLQSEGFTIESEHTWGGLAAGTAPKLIKTVADRMAKRLGFGDVMLIRARRGEDRRVQSP